MSEPEAQTSFTCPKCGAPQDYQGGSAPTIECPYCHTTLIVPEALRTRRGESFVSNTGAPNQQAAAMLEIKRLVDDSQKIAAIKLFRETFGTGLKEAKDAVEAIERGEEMAHAWTANPGVFQINNGAQHIQITRSPGGIQINTSQARGNGCASAFVALIILVVIASILLPILLSVGAFAALFPAVVPEPTAVRVTARALASPTAPFTPTPGASPTPGFATLVKTFGKQGTAPGQFNDARAIAVDRNGNVYVGDYLSARIQRFDSQGKFQDQWLPAGKTLLYSLAADFRGNLYAAENGQIVKYEGASGKKLGILSYPVEGDGFDQIVVTPDGGLFATWYESRNGLITSLEGHRDDLVRFDRDGKVTSVIKGIISSQTESLALDNKIAVDTQGNLYVLAREGDDAVFKFSPTGKYINRFGGSGSRLGQWNVAWSIATDSQGRVYVGASDGILVYDATGNYLDKIANEHTISDAMTFDAQDHLWIAARDTVQEFQFNQ